MTRVWLPDSVETFMKVEATGTIPCETGGVLLGYWTEGGEAVVTAATGPGPAASHSETEFIPDDDYQEQMIDEAYVDSGRRHTYLGDWHTHPYGGNLLSYKDRRTLQRIARHPEARAPIPLMAVLAHDEDWRLAIWRYERPVTLLARLTLHCDRECAIVRF
jgi:integrative and conjugative element protein (TIGR02256 family)